MDSPLRFDCPECGKELKAPPEYAGKRVRCTRTTCRHSFPIPGGTPTPVPSPVDRDDDFDVATLRTPLPFRNAGSGLRRRAILRLLLWVSVSVVGGSAFGVYRWVGQPTSSQVAAYENYFRTGNELFDLHGPISTDAQAREVRPSLRVKAEEPLQFRNALHTGGRRGDALRRKYDRDGKALVLRHDAR